MTELRPYPFQNDLVDELRAAIVRSRSAVLTLSTGAGKTVIAGRVAKLAADKGSTTLLLVHRRELVRQSIKTLKLAVPGMEIGVEAAGWPSIPWARLQVGMVQSIARRKFTCNPDIVIVDEAHHCRAPTWEKVLARWPDAVRIGLTATPERLDGKGLGEHFDEMVLGPSMAWLVDNNYLAPTRTMTVPVSWEDMGSVRRTRSGDYHTKDLAKRVTDKVVADAAAAYMRYCPGTQAIFFGVDTAHSKRVCEKLRSMGVVAEHVDGKDHISRRDRVINDFADNRVQVLGNCDLVSEGLDMPNCDVAILGRRTKSTTVYLQQAGRPMRYVKTRPGKVATILDVAGVVYDLGLPDDPREWTLADGEVSHKPTRQAETPRPCDNCRTCYRGAVCSHCGHYRASGASPVNEKDVELVDATPTKRRTAQYRRNAGMDRAEAIMHLCTTRWQFVQECIKIREELGYKPGWEWIAAKLVWDQLQGKAS